MNLEACASRVYELHRHRVPWDSLPEPERCALIVAYWRARSGYEQGRRQPREVRIAADRPAPPTVSAQPAVELTGP